MRTERIGFALCGSFCNHPKILMLFEEMAESFEMVPILSENTARYDTRFGLADDLIARVERAAGRPAIRTIVEAEPFGPQNLADVLVIAPCTGNTLAKLAHGITDGPVTMAAKSHLRNGKPVVVARARRISPRSSTGRTTTSFPSGRMTRRVSPPRSSLTFRSSCRPSMRRCAAYSSSRCW